MSFSHENVEFLSQEKASCDRVNAECLCFRNPPNSDMDYRIFNVHKHVNACDCTRGCTDTVRESVLKVDSGRKIPCCTGESAAFRSHAVPADLHHGTFMAKFTINLRKVRALVPCYPHGQSCLHSKVHNEPFSLYSVTGCSVLSTVQDHSRVGKVEFVAEGEETKRSF